MSHDPRNEDVRDTDTTSSSNSNSSTNNMIYLQHEMVNTNMRPHLSTPSGQYPVTNLPPNVHPHNFVSQHQTGTQQYFIVHPHMMISPESGQQIHQQQQLQQRQQQQQSHPPLPQKQRQQQQQQTNPAIFSSPIPSNNYQHGTSQPMILDHNIQYQYQQHSPHLVQTNVIQTRNVQQHTQMVNGPILQHQITHQSAEHIPIPQGTTLMARQTLQPPMATLISSQQKNQKDTKRAMQNRKAQKAFRKRKEQYIKLLENEAKLIDEVLKKNEDLKSENEKLRDVLYQLIQKLKDNGIEFELPSDFIEQINNSIVASKKLQEQHQELAKSFADGSLGTEKKIG